MRHSPSLVLEAFCWGGRSVRDRVLSGWRWLLLFLIAALTALNFADTSVHPVAREREALRSQDLQGRRNAVLRLGAWRATEAWPEFVAALQDQDRTVRELAMWSLGRLGDRRAVPLLCQAVEEALPGDANAFPLFAVRSLRRLQDPRAMPTLRRIVRRTHDVGLREDAIHAMSAISLEEARPFLLRLVRLDPDENVRTAAAVCLARLADPQTLPAFVDAARADHPELRLAVARSLVAFGEAARPTLQALERDEDEEVREAATRSLRNLLTGRRPPGEEPLPPEPELGDAELVAVDLVASNAEDFHPIEHAPLYLASSWEPLQVQEWLTHPQSDVRSNACLLLGNMPALPGPARDRLVQVLHDPDSGVRWSAAKALGKLRHPASLEYLLEATADPDKDVREDVLEALGRLTNMEDPRVEKALLAGLREPYETVRIQAVIALARLADPAARQALKSTASSDPSPTVRSLALRLSTKVQPRYVN